MAKKTVSIRIVAHIERLRREVNAGSLAAPVVYLTSPMNDGRGTSLAVPLDYYMVGSNRAKAYRFVTELRNFQASEIPEDERFDAFERRYKDDWSNRSPEEWGLALIFWRDVYRDELDPDQHIALSLADWLGIELSAFRPFRDASWFSRLIGSRVGIHLDPQWVALNEYERTVRLHTLEAAVDIGGPTLVRMALVVLGAVPAVRAGWVLAVAFQSIVGLLDFLFTSWEAERDDVITEQEVEDVSWALLGIFGFGLLQLLILGARVTLAGFRLLTYLGEAALQLMEEIPSRAAAAEAGYGEFVASVYRDDEAPDNVFVLLDQ